MLYLTLTTNAPRTLASIEQFAKKKVSRNMIMRLIMRKSDAGTVQEFRETLRHSLDIFGVSIEEFSDNVFRLMVLQQLRSNITIQENLASIASQLGAILEAVQAQNVPTGTERLGSEQERLEQVKQIPNEGGSGARGTPVIAGRASQGAVVPPVQEIYMPPPPLPPFPNIQSSHGKFDFSAIGRDHITTDSSHHVSNTNSGNTTTTITKNSNNDSSVRVMGRKYRISL